MSAWRNIKRRLFGSEGEHEHGAPPAAALPGANTAQQQFVQEQLGSEHDPMNQELFSLLQLAPGHVLRARAYGQLVERIVRDVQQNGGGGARAPQHVRYFTHAPASFSLSEVMNNGRDQQCTVLLSMHFPHDTSFLFSYADRLGRITRSYESTLNATLDNVFVSPSTSGGPPAMPCMCLSVMLTVYGSASASAAAGDGSDHYRRVKRTRIDA